jgi:hypothetical protein
MLTSPLEPLSFTSKGKKKKKKEVRVIMELEVPKKVCYWPNVIVGKKKEGKKKGRRREECKAWKTSQNYPFWTYSIYYLDNNIHKLF